MAIKWRIKPETFMDKVEIARVNNTIARLKLQDGMAIDSYSMSPNGPILSAIFLVGGGYIAETRMGGKHAEFDASPVKVLVNYRITYGEHEAQADAAVSTAAAGAGGAAESPSAAAQLTKFVSVVLRHTDSVYTNMSFFGEDVESWLDFVLEAYPPALVIS